MNPVMLDGKKVSEKIKNNLKEKINSLKQRSGKTPCLATILVGENPASKTYVNMKIKACESIGMQSKCIKLSENATTDDLLIEIHKLNDDKDVHGILLQHPCPVQIDERKAFDSILPEKDVDGVTSINFGRMVMGIPCFQACTPLGMIRLLKEYQISVQGLHCCVVGRSQILGKPMAMLLLNENATVTICHSKTKGLSEIIKKSDLVVGAVGKPEFIKADWIQPGTILLDAGYNEGNLGDIDINGSKEKSSFYTPVPGGVGPMTIAILLEQTYFSFEESIKKF